MKEFCLHQPWKSVKLKVWAYYNQICGVGVLNCPPTQVRVVVKSWYDSLLVIFHKILEFISIKGELLAYLSVLPSPITFGDNRDNNKNE